MSKPLTFAQFLDTRVDMSAYAAADALKIDVEHFLCAGAKNVCMYAETLYVMEAINLPGGGYMVDIERDSFSGTRDQMAARLYFEWYASECTNNDEYDLTGLTTLMEEWCEWTGTEHQSADEILLSLSAEPQDRRSAETRRRITFLEWFIRVWGEAEERHYDHNDADEDCGWDGEYSAEDDAEYCRSCGEPNDDGEGWDGMCGDCADREEQPAVSAINLTMNWRTTLPMLLAVYVDGDAEGRKKAYAELQRMAFAADVASS